MLLLVFRTGSFSEQEMQVGFQKNGYVKKKLQAGMGHGALQRDADGI